MKTKEVIRNFVNGVTKKVSKKDLELKELQDDAIALTNNKSKSAYFTYVDTTKGRRYYTRSGLPIKKSLLEFMYSNGYKFKLERKMF